MELSIRIKQARRKAGLSQNALASALGVKRGAVGNWESASGGGPTLANLSKLAKTTQVSLEWLATGRGPILLARDPHSDIPVVDADLVDDLQERRLLQAYRSVSARMRITLQELVEEMAVLRNGKRISPPPPQPFAMTEFASIRLPHFLPSVLA